MNEQIERAMDNLLTALSECETGLSPETVTAIDNLIVARRASVVAPIVSGNEVALPSDVLNFLYFVTLGLQVHRSRMDAQKDNLFQQAYKLYVKYDVEKARQRPLTDRQSTQRSEPTERL